MKVQAEIPFLGNVPPDGISASEQMLESRIWRIQLDLATGGVRSMLVRRGPERHELADPEALLQPFQGVMTGPGAGSVSVYRKSRIRFDPESASLRVESELAGMAWITVFRVEGDCPCLSVAIEPGIHAGPGIPGVALPFSGQASSGWEDGGSDWMRRAFSGFQLVVAGCGILCRPEVERVDLSDRERGARLLFQSAAEGRAAAEKTADELRNYLRMGSRRC